MNKHAFNTPLTSVSVSPTTFSTGAWGATSKSAATFAALALAALAGGGAPADGAGWVLERGGTGGAGLRQLVGRPAGNGRWWLLFETPGHLADRQLEPAWHHDLHQPAALAEVVRSRPLDGLPADRRHLGDGHHRQRRQPLAGAGPSAGAALRAGETLRGAAGRQPVRPLEPDEPRSEAALARQLRRAAAADPQAAQPLHRRLDGTHPLDGGHGGRPALAQPAGHRPGRSAAWAPQAS